MHPHLAMGIFALYVVLVSLARLLASREFPRLTAMKKAWGRSRGMLLHFLANVALPLVIGIVFMSRGIAGSGTGGERHDHDAVPWSVSIKVLTAPAGGTGMTHADALLRDDPSSGDAPDGGERSASLGSLPMLSP